MSDTISNIEKGGLAGVIRQGITNYMKDVHTCLPGKIVSFNSVKQTATVQPLIQRVFKNGDNEKPVNLPQLINVVVWQPRAGGWNITFPIKPEDECLVLFSERSIDNWWKFGESKPPNDWRLHDLSDAICLVGMSSEPGVITNYDPTNFHIRNEANSQYIKLRADGTIQAVTGTTEILVNPDGTIRITAPDNIAIDSPLVTMSGDLTVAGTITGDTDVLSGPDKISGKNHVHGGVTTGGANTGVPV